MTGSRIGGAAIFGVAGLHHIAVRWPAGAGISDDHGDVLPDAGADQASGAIRQDDLGGGHAWDFLGLATLFGIFTVAVLTVLILC